jgi:molybdopterin/thiamine biosynthesis adenylyltransferase
VIAAALRYGGNVMAGAPGVACYRCLFEEPADVPSCADAGVLGPVVGAIGGAAASIALGLVRGDRRYAGALLAFDDLRAVSEPRIVRFAPRPGCPACARAPISPIATPIRVAEVK